MTTTALVAELIVIGLQALVWIALLATLVFGPDWIKAAGDVFDKAALLATAITTGFAYLVGMVIDQVSDAISQIWEERILGNADVKRMSDTQREQWRSKWENLIESESDAQEIDYMRSRRRILRGSLFNILLTAILALLLTWRQVHGGAPFVAFASFISVFSFVMAMLVAFVYQRITIRYFTATKTIQEIREDKKESSDVEVSVSQIAPLGRIETGRIEPMFDINALGLVVGFISLIIAIVAEIRSARLKHALEIQLSEIKATNSLIINQANNESGEPLRRLNKIHGAAESQKTIINGLTKVLKLRFWDLWETPDDVDDSSE